MRKITVHCNSYFYILNVSERIRNIVSAVDSSVRRTCDGSGTRSLITGSS